MESTSFPAPITYINEIKVTSQDKNASGFYDQLNQEQYNALQKWKQELLTKKITTDFTTYDDLYLLRFLRARKFDLEKTTLMFQKFLKWREDEKVDELRTSFDFNEILQVKEIYPHGYHKVDKMGRPLYIELLSKLDVGKLFKVTTEERMVKYYVKEYERLMKWRFPGCSAAMKKPIEQSLTILDCNTLGVSSLVGKTRSFVQLATNIAQDYYPEMLGQMYLLNTGWLFKALWAIVKTFMDPKTAGKIHMLGGSYITELVKYIDEENIPECINGKCKCENIEGGCLYSDIGPWNPNGGIQVGNNNTNKGLKSVQDVVSGQ